MPFESEAQRRFMYARHPEIAKRWEKHTPKDKPLPEKKEALEQLVAKHAAVRVLPPRRPAIPSMPEPGGWPSLEPFVSAGRRPMPVERPLVTHAPREVLDAFTRKLFPSGVPADPRRSVPNPITGFSQDEIAKLLGKQACDDACTLYGVKAAGLLGTIGQGIGKGLGWLGKGVGFLPTGVGNVIGAGLGAAGGALQGLAGGEGFGGMAARAGAGALSGLPGGAGIIAPTIAGMGVNSIMSGTKRPPGFQPGAPGGFRTGLGG